MDRTPTDGQRMLFSATLDRGIDALVKRYLSDPVTHSVDSEQSPVNTMAHHVLHVTTDDRLPVLVDLTSAPGRTMVFTRTKHRAKQLTRQLNAHGVPSVEMHGNLTQNVRTRNLAAFSDGTCVVTGLFEAKNYTSLAKSADPNTPMAWALINDITFDDVPRRILSDTAGGFGGWISISTTFPPS